MSQQFINLGAQPDDNTGDDARSGGRKINENFSELYGKVQNVQNLNLTAGPVTALPAGSAPTAAITGTYPNHQLALGLPLGPTGLPGAGAPTSADILALADRDDLMREIAGAGVPDRPIAVLDFTRGVQWVKGAYAGASILALVAAIPGSLYARASTATYFDSDGLMKTAAVNVPRIDYDPVTRVCRGYLREPSKTNLLTWSDDMTQASWQKLASTVVPNNVVGPDGLMTMDTLVQDTSTGVHAVQVTLSLDAAQQLTYSQVVKAAGHSKGRIQINALSGNRLEGIFDLAVGTISATAVGTASGAKANIAPLGNDLYRLSITGQAAAETTVNLQVGIVLREAVTGSQSFTGDGVSGIAMGCGQVEVGDLSSYIQTTASTATRAIESLQIATLSWLNLAEGTIVAEFEATQPGAGNDIAFNMGTGTLSDFIAVYRSSSAAGPCYVRSHSASVSQISATANMPWPATPAARAAVGWKASDAAWAWEGALAGSNNAYVVPLSMPLLILSWSSVVNSVRLKRILIYPRRLSNAKLQALTNQSLWS